MNDKEHQTVYTHSDIFISFNGRVQKPATENELLRNTHEQHGDNFTYAKIIAYGKLSAVNDYP